MKRLLPLLLLIAAPAFADVHMARYGVAETFNFVLFNADGTLDVDESDGGTEVSISCNEGAETTATNDFADEGNFYSIALTAAELQCERATVVVAATTTNVFFIETFGNASAMTPSFAADTVAISGDTTAADNLETAWDLTPGSVPSLGILDQGTAQSATATTLVLRAAAAFGDDTVLGATILVCGSTQTYCQTRKITDYVNSTDTATVDTWTVTPSGTITYYVFASAPGSSLDAQGIQDALETDLSSLANILSGVTSLLDGVNVEFMNDAELCGTGQPGDLWTGCP